MLSLHDELNQHKSLDSIEENEILHDNMDVENSEFGDTTIKFFTTKESKPEPLVIFVHIINFWRNNRNYLKNICIE